MKSSSEEAGTQFFRVLMGRSAVAPRKRLTRKDYTVIDREQDRPTRWLKEAVHIRKEGHRAMHQDEGSYQLIHAYDSFLDQTADRCIKTRKN